MYKAWKYQGHLQQSIWHFTVLSSSLMCWIIRICTKRETSRTFHISNFCIIKATELSIQRGSSPLESRFMPNIATISLKFVWIIVSPLKQHSGWLWTTDKKVLQKIQENQSRFDGTGPRHPRGSTASVILDHRYSPARASGRPLPAEQGSTLHRYSIGCSLSHTQSQWLGEEKKRREITVFSAL